MSHADGMPFIDASGDLVVPINAGPSWRWWELGRSVLAILDDLGAPAEVRRRYAHLQEAGNA